MKKLFSTILAVMVAVVMSFAVFAFTGCDPTNPNPNPDPEPNPKPATGLVTGNATYDGIIGTEYAGFKLASTVSMGGEDATVNATVNTNGKADILMEAPGSCMYYFMRDWKVYGTDSSEAITDFSQAELYGYVDINQFIESMLEYVGENGGMEIPAEVTGLIKLDKILEGSLGGLNYAVISLADAANAVTVNETDKTVTVDFNKMAYNMVNQVKAGVTSLKGDTTLSELLGNATLKKYAQIITELVSTEDVINYVADLAKTLGELGNATETLEEGEITGSESGVAYVAAAVELINDVITKVQPDENSSVYDYIVKVLSSQELLDAINAMLQEMGAPAGSGLTKKISEFTLSEIIGMIPTEGEALTLDGLKEMINGYITAYTSGITETALTVSYEDDGEEVQFSVTGAKLVYTYGANGLTAMDLDLNIAVGENFEMGIDATLTLSKTAYAASEFTTLPADLPEIEDIDFGDLIPSPGPGPSIKDIPVLSAGEYTLHFDEGEEVEFKINLGEEYAGKSIILNIYGVEDYTIFFYDYSEGDIVSALECDYYEDMVVTAKLSVNAESGDYDIVILALDNGEEEIDYSLYEALQIPALGENFHENEVYVSAGEKTTFKINVYGITDDMIITATAEDINNIMVGSGWNNDVGSVKITCDTWLDEGSEWLLVNVLLPADEEITEGTLIPVTLTIEFTAPEPVTSDLPALTEGDHTIQATGFGGPVYVLEVWEGESWCIASPDGSAYIVVGTQYETFGGVIEDYDLDVTNLTAGTYYVQIMSNDMMAEEAVDCNFTVSIND